MATLDKKIFEYINKDFDEVEPYVDKIIKYISSRMLCVVILDNVDLFEDTSLETRVFAEGLALSKRVNCHMIVSIRDTTYSKHMVDSTFDAYELRKMWIDPPPFKEILSKRLIYAQKVIEGKQVTIQISGKNFLIPNLGAFFQIVQQSILDGNAGQFIEAVADMNVRRGLTFITNFLTSGHIEAERAIHSYFEQDGYQLPFHEVFRGAMLGQWTHFSESRSECVNLFDARLGSYTTQLLRLYLIKYLTHAARRSETKNVAVFSITEIFTRTGASESQILEVLDFLWKRALIKSESVSKITSESFVSISRSGAYYSQNLIYTLVYVEVCMYDTGIADDDIWREITKLTTQVEYESDRVRRITMRQTRLVAFLKYLSLLERKFLSLLVDTKYLECIEQIGKDTRDEIQEAVEKTKKYQKR